MNKTTISKNPNKSTTFISSSGLRGEGTNVQEARNNAQVQLEHEPNPVDKGDVRTSEDKPE